MNTNFYNKEKYSPKNKKENSEEYYNDYLDCLIAKENRKKQYQQKKRKNSKRNHYDD
jgi:hypothetical protein